MKKTLAIVLILAFLVTFSCFAQGSKESSQTGEKEYIVAASCDYPPLEYIDDNGNIVGYEMDLIRAIASEMGIKIKIVNVSFDGIIAGIQGKQYDIGASGLTITEERKITCNFSTPILQFSLSIVTNKDESQIKNESDLVGKRVGVQLGTTCQFACEDAGIDVKTYDEAPSAILDLANGNLDAVVLDSVVANDFVLSNDSYSKILKVAGSFQNADDMGLAVIKGNSALLDILNDGIAKLQESGELANLKAKYGLN